MSKETYIFKCVSLSLIFSIDRGKRHTYVSIHSLFWPMHFLLHNQWRIWERDTNTLYNAVLRSIWTCMSTVAGLFVLSLSTNVLSLREREILYTMLYCCLFERACIRSQVSVYCLFWHRQVCFHDQWRESERERRTV